MVGRIRKALIVLGYVALLIFSLRAGELLMRPDTHGMADDACRHAETDQPGDRWSWWRRLIGGRPEFDDWTRLCRFAEDNAAILRSGHRVDVVFMGDSITEFWLAARPDLFTGPHVNRGISTQSSAQILSRFQSDVVALKPRAVHLIAGTNDITGTPGPSTPQAWRDTMTAMIDLARANGITVILGTLPPMASNPFDTAHRPAQAIAQQNAWLAQVAKEKGLVLADYHAVLAGGDGGFRPGLALDNFHPSPKGYDAMRPVLDRALAEAGLAPGS